MDPLAFSGGGLVLEMERARAALEHVIGERLNISAALAALGVSEIVDENMANAARVHAVESGKDTPGRVLIAFGGAGPLHAWRIAEKLGIGRVLVPPGAGVGSALGFLRAPVAFEMVRTRLQRLSTFDAAAINALYAEMRGDIEAIVRQGTPTLALAEARHAFMRYRGQGHEVMVALPAQSYAPDDGRLLERLFADAYQRLYSRTIPGVDVEVVSWALSLSAPPEPVAHTPQGGEPHIAVPVGSRMMLDVGTGKECEVPIYRRAELHIGAQIRGPALITEAETSTVVGPGFDAAIDGFGCIELRRRQALL
jgi:N-methylhydantoinase A